MFDFSFAELALIVIVAVVFIGPKELPAVLRAVAKAMRAIRKLGDEVRHTFDELAKETGLEEGRRMIEGLDGKMYETFAPPPGTVLPLKEEEKTGAGSERG